MGLETQISELGLEGDAEDWQKWASGKPDFSDIVCEVRRAFTRGFLVSTEGLKDASQPGMGAR